MALTEGQRQCTNTGDRHTLNARLSRALSSNGGFAHANSQLDLAERGGALPCRAGPGCNVHALWDDGYLSASEIASLELDADWVLLSACNTAAGGAGSAEALSGLARAFFHVHARALLASHWAVDSPATVKLITSAVGEMARDKDIGRAEAMRRAMLALIDSGTAHAAHPATWAPFVVVGEGAAQARDRIDPAQ